MTDSSSYFLYSIFYTASSATPRVSLCRRMHELNLSPRLYLIPHSARSHPHSAKSHSHSARSHPHLARSHPSFTRSHQHLARSHPLSSRTYSHSARSYPTQLRLIPAISNEECNILSLIFLRLRAEHSTQVSISSKSFMMGITDSIVE
jgi:hypothetical protein